MRKLQLLALGLVAAFILPSITVAQEIEIVEGEDSAGVSVNAEGLVQARKIDRKTLVQMRQRAAKAMRGAGEAQLAYVSLPRAIEQLNKAVNAGEPVPNEVRYLGGITQLRYIFVYPDKKDIVLVGPAEEIVGAGGIMPTGAVSGRPVIHLEDLIVAHRMLSSKGMQVQFGCSIDPNPGSLKAAGEIVKKYRSRAKMVKALREAMGPQKVRLMGVDSGSRMATMFVMADYRLKLHSLGADRMPVAGIGHAVDNTRAAGNRFWFEPSYDSLLASEDGNSYQLRGDRVKLLAGEFSFAPKGATPKAKAYAKRFTSKFGQLAIQVPEYADLQNTIDMALLAGLIKKDKLDEKAGFDFAAETNGIKTKVYATPKTANTHVHFVGRTLVAGGVSFRVAPLLSDREVDQAGELNGTRKGWNGEAIQVVDQKKQTAAK